MTSPGSSTCCFASGTFLPAIQAKIFFLGSSDVPDMGFFIARCGTRTHLSKTFAQQL